ncbi:hypothetical protein [Azospirillum sp. INR13]|uniref:hypothetical protein n=1 Tax=Azospirillum sp. INR13 TaxID=2596919 RepID=UPI0021057543|nr:hypothetical protein [Azospirillum sp. INR13]
MPTVSLPLPLMSSTLWAFAVALRPIAAVIKAPATITRRVTVKAMVVSSECFLGFQRVGAA